MEEVWRNNFHLREKTRRFIFKEADELMYQKRLEVRPLQLIHITNELVIRTDIEN